MFPIEAGESYVDEINIIRTFESQANRDTKSDKNVVPDHATAEAVLALCQLVHLRNAYNGDWVPDWTDDETKYTIEFSHNGNIRARSTLVAQYSILFFKTAELRNEFLRNFSSLIEKLKPLYGTKEGGDE